MFRSYDDFLNGISLGDAYNIASSSLVENRANSSMISPVRHPFVNTRFYLDDNLAAWSVLIKKLAKTQFASLSGFFRHETT